MSGCEELHGADFHGVMPTVRNAIEALEAAGRVIVDFTLFSENGGVCAWIWHLPASGSQAAEA